MHRARSWRTFAAVLLLGLQNAMGAAAAAGLEEANRLYAEAQRLNSAGSYEAALVPARRALELRQAALNAQPVDIADSAQIVAQLLLATGDTEAAKPLLERTLEIRKRALPDNHPDTAEALRGVARYYFITGAYAQAQPLYEAAAKIIESNFGAQDPRTATALLRLAAVNATLAERAKATELFKRVLAIREKALGGEHRDTAEALRLLAGHYINDGNFRDSEQLLLRSRTITEKILGPQHEDTIAALGTLAILYSEMGLYDRAEPLLTQVLVFNEKTFGPEHPDTAATLNNIAINYFITGDYRRAAASAERALAIYRKISGRDHPDTGEAMGNLSQIYLALNDVAAARPLSERSVAIREKSLGPDHPLTADALLALADLELRTGAFAAARPLFERVLAIRETVLGLEDFTLLDPLFGLAELRRREGDTAVAQRLYQRAVAIGEKLLPPGHPDISLSRNGLAAVAWQQGDWAQATTLLQRSLAEQIKTGERFLLAGSEVRKRAYLEQLDRSMFTYVSYSLAAGNPDAVMLGLDTVLQYKGRVLDAMSDSMARLRQSQRREDRALFEQLSDVANEFSTLMYQGAGTLAGPQYPQRVAELTRRQELLEADLAKRSAVFRRQSAPLTVAAVARAIPKDAALIEWFRYVPFNPRTPSKLLKQPAARYVAYVLKNGGNPVALDVGDASAIDALLQRFRAAAGDPARTDVKDLAAELSEKIIAALRPHIAGVRHLLMSPDGALSLLPMAAMLDEHGDYLLQHTEISYLTSGRDLLRLKDDAPSRNAPLVFAAPDYGRRAGVKVAQNGAARQRSEDLDRSGLIFRALPGSQLEARALQKLLKLDPTRLLLGGAATEARLKAAHAPAIVHLASHGFFLTDGDLASGAARTNGFAAATENPLLRSGIALAGANARRSGTSDDGILTALEASRLDLNGTQLVVLSACNSGVGEIRNGEGVYGLRRALTLAGAQTQVTSLWKVSDDAVLSLMVDYYERLLAGQGRSAALRQAQLAMLKRAQQMHPYYWASVVAIGEWKPLATPFK